MFPSTTCANPPPSGLAARGRPYGPSPGGGGGAAALRHRPCASMMPGKGAHSPCLHITELRGPNHPGVKKNAILAETTKFLNENRNKKNAYFFKMHVVAPQCTTKKQKNLCPPPCTRTTPPYKNMHMLCACSYLFACSCLFACSYLLACSCLFACSYLFACSCFFACSCLEEPDVLK